MVIMFAVLIPIYHDEESVAQLIKELDTHLQNYPHHLDVFIVNDGGLSCAEYLKTPQNIRQINEIMLAVNLGHQRAIAVGLTELATRDDYEAVVIMDGDGEDKPEDVFRLIDSHFKKPEYIIVASRTKRSEGIGFRLFYNLYRRIFLILTGKRIDFGNFMLIPATVLSSIVFNANLWNHLAATVLSAHYPIERLKTFRGERYQGQSKMNFERLVTHGLSAISVYLNTIFTRMLIMLSILLAVAVSAIGVVVSVRFLTDLAIPGWATNLVGILSIIILQLILTLMLSMFAALNQRGTVTETPQSKIRNFIKEVKDIYQRLD
jgi:hypothetical protein